MKKESTTNKKIKTKILKKINLRRRIEDIKEQREWDKEWNY